MEPGALLLSGILIASCVLPWLILEGVFFFRMRSRFGGSPPPLPEESGRGGGESQ